MLGIAMISKTMKRIVQPYLCDSQTPLFMGYWRQKTYYNRQIFFYDFKDLQIGCYFPLLGFEQIYMVSAISNGQNLTSSFWCHIQSQFRTHNHYSIFIIFYQSFSSFEDVLTSLNVLLQSQFRTHNL